MLTLLGLRMRSSAGTTYGVQISVGRTAPIGDAKSGAITDTTTFGSGDLRNSLPRFSADARRANAALVELLRAVATRKQAEPLTLLD